MNSTRSSSSPLLLLLAVAGLLTLLIGGGAMAWFWLGRQPSDGAVASPLASRAPGTSGTSAVEAAPASLESGAPHSELASPDGAGAAPPAAVPTGAASAADALDGRSALLGDTLRGTLAIPPGAPFDESLRIRVTEPTTDWVALVQSGASQDELRAREREARNSPDALVEVVPDALGRFEIPLADLPERFDVHVDGRFLYLERPAGVDRRETEAQALDLAPELGACVRGRLLAPDSAGGLPAALREASAELNRPALDWATTERSLLSRKATADERGEFELRGVPASGAWNLSGEAFGYACEPLSGLELAPGEIRVVDIALALGATLSGRVVDEDAGPVAGANVTASDTGTLWGGQAMQGRDDETDAEGRFELSGVAGGTQRLMVKATGFLMSSGTTVDVAAGETRADITIVLERGEPVRGIVVWPDGSPAGDAAVEGRLGISATGANAFEIWRGIEASARCDSEGRFVLTGLAQGEVKLSASASRGQGAVSELGSAEIEGFRRADGEARLVLLPAAALAGRVETPEGQPISAFSVSWQRSTSAPAFDPGAMEQETRAFEDPEGRFEVAGLAPGTWTVWAEAGGCASSEPLEVELPWAAGTAELVIRLARGARVSGTVRDPAGTPVAKALVSMDAAGGSVWMSRMKGGAEPPSTHSDDAGHFELEPLPAGPLSLRARLAGFASSGPLPLELAPGETRENVELVLRVGGSITGEVFGKDGSPAAGVMVMAAIPDGSDAKNGSTDASGRFAFEHLDPASWQVIAMLSMDASLFGGDGEASEGGDGAQSGGMAEFLDGMKFTFVEVRDGEEAHVVLGAPPAHPVLVSGTLSAGEIGVQAMVSFIPEGADALGSMKIGSSDAQGHFEQRLDKPGRYVISVQSGGFGGPQNTVEFRRTIPEQESCEIELALPLGRVSGRVHAPDGRPAAGARVSLAPDGAIRAGSMIGQQYAEGLTDADGRFQFEWLAAGRYTVAAGGSFMNGLFGSLEAGGRQVVGGLQLGEGQALERVDFHLQEPGKLAGRVSDASGAPLSGAAVFVRDGAGRFLERFSSSMTDASGRYELSGLAAGSYTVFARSGDQASPESAPVDVRAGEEARADLALAAGTMLLVRVELGEGEEILADVSVVDAAGREVNGVMSMQDIMNGLSGGLNSGESRVGPLAPGLYRVTATTADGRSKTKPVELKGQAERSLVIRIKE